MDALSAGNPTPPGRIAASIGAAAVLLACATLPAQEPSSESEPLPTTVLKRMAEAADGHRTGEMRYFVYSHEFPHDVEGVFESEEEALAAMNELGPDFGMLPILTDRDIPRHVDPAYERPPLLILGFDCPWHEPSSLCRQTDYPEAETTIPFDAIDSTRVQVFHGGDVFREMVFGPGELDALFLSLSALEKFYIPYLARVYGVEFAAEYRREFLDWLGSAEIMR